MELLQMVLDEAQRLNRYIQNLLDMTRLGGGNLTLQRQWVDINDILGSALERLLHELEPLQVEIMVAEGFPLLYVQGILIEQALVNVLDNGARFSPPGGILTLTATHDSAHVEIDVCDQGPGIRVLLSRKEYELLKLFVTHPGRVLTHQQILREIWSPQHEEEIHHLRVLIGHLRQKLGDQPTRPRYIITEQGVGYRLMSDD